MTGVQTCALPILAYVQQYRFAATEYVDPPRVPRAIATVMFGTLVAAYLGPEAGDRMRLLGGWIEFTGSFIIVAVFLVLSAATLLALETPHPHAVMATGTARPLGAIVRRQMHFPAAPDHLVRHGPKPVELVGGRIVDHVPATPAVVLPRDLHVRAQPRLQSPDPVPEGGECGTFSHGLLV